MKHNFNYETGKTTYCGDSYCDGHRENFMVCSCGHKQEVSDYLTHKERKDLEFEHRLTYLESKIK